YARKYFVPSEAKDHIPLGESDPSDVVTVNVKEGQYIKWSNFPTPPPEVKAILLYRSTANGSDLHFVGALRNPPPSSFGDFLPDDELVERRTMRFGNNLGAVAKCTRLVKHPNSYRFFAAGNPEDPAALYFSEPNEPDHWEPSSVLYQTTRDGPVQNIVAFGDALLVFYRHSVWAWRGLDPAEDATWIKLPTGVGTDAPYSIALTPGSLTFFGQSGIYALSPAVLDMNVTIEPTEGLIRNFAA